MIQYTRRGKESKKMAEIRKLLPRGGSLHVTLPRRWLRRLGLTRAHYVQCEFTGNAIMITPLTEEPKHDPSETTLPRPR